MTTHEVFLSRSQTREVTSLSGSQIDRLEKAGKFPARIKLSERRVAWCLTDVQAWMEGRKSAMSTVVTGAA
jgi:prophage regulatory protein